MNAFSPQSLPNKFSPSKSFSHLLIVIMIGVFLLSGHSLVPFLGLHSFGFGEFRPLVLASQIAGFQFIHGGVLHLIMNSLFLYQAGPEVESRMSKMDFISFFLFSTVFVGVSLFFFSEGVTIGMSGFCMALLSYLWITLYQLRSPLAWQILFLLVINILVGLDGGVSFVGHLSGAIFGLAWWFFFGLRR